MKQQLPRSRRTNCVVRLSSSFLNCIGDEVGQIGED